MKKLLIFFVLLGIAQQVHAMSKPSYGNKPVGIQQLLNSHKKWLLRREQLKKELKAKKEINVKRQIDEKKVYSILIAIHGDNFLAEINKDYNVELNQLAQEQKEASLDRQRFAYVASSKISDADKAPHIPVVIHQAKEQHGIDIYWLDPQQRELVMQACDKQKTFDNTQKYLHDRMNELAAANEEAYKKIESKMVQFQTREYQQEYIRRKGELLINKELKAMPSAKIAQMMRQDKMNRE